MIVASGSYSPGTRRWRRTSEVEHLDEYTGTWGAAEAAHLARRAGFGARPEEILSMTQAGMPGAVDGLVDYQPTDSALESRIASLPPFPVNDQLRDPVGNTQLEAWWIYRMVHSTQPLQQQFALFLHDTLVSEWTKVAAGVTSYVNAGNDGSVSGQFCNLGAAGIPPDSTRKNRIVTRLMRDQHTLLLTMGHRDYRDLLLAITRDPAMLIYLDNRLNVKGKAQENYAREVMELFSMGVGNYTEEDVREIARALTGETINVACSENWPYTHVFDATKHDSGSKVVFGTSFSLTGPGAETERVIDLILDRVSNSDITPAHNRLPAASLYMAWKLITWFVLETIPISHPAVEELAQLLHAPSVNGTRYDMREAVRALLRSRLFYDGAYRNTMYKHPADFVVSALRNLELGEATDNLHVYVSYMRNMGMRLFEPPNVAGWNHGRAWINSGNLVSRYNYANRLSMSSYATDAWVDNLITSGRVSGTNDDPGILEFFSSRLLQQPLLPEETAVFLNFFAGIQGSTFTATQAQFRRKVRGALHLMISMPRYQMK